MTVPGTLRNARQCHPVLGDVEAVAGTSTLISYHSGKRHW
jgi:hypothetical protein